MADNKNEQFLKAFNTQGVGARRKGFWKENRDRRGKKIPAYIFKVMVNVTENLTIFYAEFRKRVCIIPTGWYHREFENYPEAIERSAFAFKLNEINHPYFDYTFSHTHPMASCNYTAKKHLITKMYYKVESIAGRIAFWMPSIYLCIPQSQSSNVVPKWSTICNSTSDFQWELNRLKILFF